MGWRSWEAFYDNVDEKKMMATIDAMVTLTKRFHRLSLFILIILDLPVQDIQQEDWHWPTRQFGHIQNGREPITLFGKKLHALYWHCSIGCVTRLP